MITTSLQGKLGNMMFQIATIETMGHLLGLLTGYPTVDRDIENLKKPQACTSELHGEEYFKIFKNFDWHKNNDIPHGSFNIVKVPFEYTPIIPQDNTCYVGYFQSEKYFPDRDFVLNLFEPADYISEQIKKYKDVVGTNKASIHVRRGDYIKLNSIYHVLDLDYYVNALSYLDIMGITEYLVFSNDMEWCKENFKGDQFTFIQDNSFVELFLMSKCRHHVIANSSFSWWGAWLGNDPKRITIAPRKWFVKDTPSSKDIIPESWIRL
jgi:hypothetical protein